MKSLFAFICLSLTIGCYAAKAESNPTIPISKETTTNSKGGIEWYGEKAGIFRPCKGNCVAVCKKIETIEVSTKSGSTEYVRVSDGSVSIIVEKSRVNFSDGSIK